MAMEGTLRGGLYIKHKPSHYSPAQLARYLTQIQYAPKEHCEEACIADGKFPANLENLERLMRLHLIAFPFDNTAMHYTRNHMVDVDPQSLYRRFVDERKGSFCFGQNSFFLYILRGLGYRAYNAAARVNVYEIHNLPEPTDFPPCDHIIIFAQPISDSNITYLVDVGFSTGPSRSMLFTDSDKSVVFGTTETEKFRIRRHGDPRSSLESRDGSNNHLGWAVQVQRVNKHSPDPLTAPWITLYHFNEEEFYENDIDNASFSYCTSRMEIYGGRFRQIILASKCFLLDSKNNLILDPNEAAKELANTDAGKRDLGKVLVAGKEVKYIRGGESKTIVLKTETDRIAILNGLLGIVITDEEKACIRGLPSAMDVE